MGVYAQCELGRVGVLFQGSRGLLPQPVYIWPKGATSSCDLVQSMQRGNTLILHSSGPRQAEGHLMLSRDAISMCLVSILDLGFLKLPHSSLIFLHEYPVRWIAADLIITVMLMDDLLDAWGVGHAFVRNSLYCAARLGLRLETSLQ